MSSAGTREVATAEVPDDLKQLRACMFCSVVQTWDQFDRSGCPNCEEFLQLRDNKQKVVECTSTSFEGTIAMMDPEASWVARWQRISGKSYARGVYAISVNGRLPQYIAADIMREYGKRYIPRSQQ